MFRTRILLPIIAFAIACLGACSHSESESLSDSKLGLIDADVNSRDTEFKQRAPQNDQKPGSGKLLDRSFENAPPLIPHTVTGFLPIKADNNICQSCHMPNKVAKSGAIAISSTHFLSLRPKPKLVNGVYTLPPQDSIIQIDLKHFNTLYYNCTQCHVPQSEVTVDIENLFTPEFRDEFGLHKSELKSHLHEGVH
jgi:cytochrome c-type protein NapB